MQGTQQPIPSKDAECRDLARLLDHEVACYRRLLRLAWRQNSYMKRQDVDRLEANGREWAKYLPEANASRLARERLVAALAGSIGVSDTQDAPGQALVSSGPATREAIATGLGTLKETVQKLARQNELNGNLAQFCLDLAHEETEIFKQYVLTDPSGRYGNNARPSDRGPGGVIVRQA